MNNESSEREPYFGHPMILALDKMIVVALEKATHIAPFTHNYDVGGIERVAIDIVPDGISMCCGTRELVRTGYLSAAFVLQRPIWERAATLQYLFENPAKIALWENGWPHRSRPKLHQMMSSNGGAESNEGLLRSLIDTWNSVVHGDPAAANTLSTFASDNIRGRSASKQLADTDRCGDICAMTTGALIIFSSVMDAVFSASEKDN